MAKRDEGKIVVGSGGCWFWTGSVDKHKLGWVRVYGDGGRVRHMTARQRAFEDMYGELPRGDTLIDLCGARLCINPQHMEALDKWEYKRRLDPNALVPRDVTEMRRLWKHGQGTPPGQLAKQFHRKLSTVLALLHPEYGNGTWRWLPWPDE